MTMLAGRQDDATTTSAGRTVLVVDDEPAMRTALSESLRRKGYLVTQATDGREALDRIAETRPWLVLTDMKMPKLGGISLVREIKKRTPGTHVVVMTAFGSVETAVEAIKLGASDFLLKPFAADALDHVVAGLSEPVLEFPNQSELRSTLVRPILTQDPGMRRLLDLVEGVAGSQATILIDGESGTGKELLARFIHGCSPRAHRPFIAVNCAALPEGLLESELFGHERGAFTGALMRKLGKFEMAHQGTLLLDEISEMNLPLQAKLLRVLQEREVDRIGGSGPVSVNIRVIATTNKPLHREVEAGRFREDLYYRLNVFPITVPPLRARRSDIALLARHFAQSAAVRNGVTAPTLSESAVAHLEARTWKGNVRELENAVERAVLVSAGRMIEPEHFPDEIAGLRNRSQDFLPAEVPSSTETAASSGSLWEMERDLIVKTLARVAQNRTKAAKELGISVRTLRNKLREYRQGNAGSLLAME
ncbi:sigma-54-dependent Fis family transcriptional regulator [Nitrospira sp.]|nr:sigma-54-dependent Fis family transcriptional regulator [Nitrospira sp.]